MKKLFMGSIITLLGVLVLYGCGKATIVGTWTHDSFVYTFNKDNTCSYEVLGTTMKCKYTTDGDKISILYDGNSAPFETTYHIEKDKLHILDSFDNDVEYTRK